MEAHTLGIDFGTESARAVLVRCSDGAVVATEVYRYPHGVLDRTFPGGGRVLPPDWALQHPGDWLEALEHLLGRLATDSVVGIGVDFTACTVLPTSGDGTPLCQLPEFRSEPHAWPKLWKHHGAQRYADRINAAYGRPGSEFLRWYGGKTSSEWLWAKGWEVLAEAPHVMDAAARWIEAGDWIVWQLTGREVRSACQAGYKAHWQKREGYPPASFWASLDPALPSVLDRLAAPEPVGSCAGGLAAAWTERAGLRPGVSVAVAVIDAHAAVPAVGVREPGRLVAVMGTSTCHLLVDGSRREVRGIAGVVEDGILPGWFGYEAGQASVGDTLQWFVRTSVPERWGRDEATVFRALETEAARLGPGQSGLLALDWWNGCRTPLVDADLLGVVVGLNLRTEPPELYRALLEAAAYGTRRVVETFEAGGIPIREVVACGGLAERNTLLLQVTADVLGREVWVPEVAHASAVGAAIYAAAAAGVYESVEEAVTQMGSKTGKRYSPDRSAQRVYEDLYAEYLELARYFGEGANPLMKRLKAMRVQDASQPQSTGGGGGACGAG